MGKIRVLEDYKVKQLTTMVYGTLAQHYYQFAYTQGQTSKMLKHIQYDNLFDTAIEELAAAHAKLLGELGYTKEFIQEYYSVHPMTMDEQRVEVGKLIGKGMTLDEFFEKYHSED